MSPNSGCNTRPQCLGGFPGIYIPCGLVDAFWGAICKLETSLNYLFLSFLTYTCNWKCHVVAMGGHTSNGKAWFLFS